MAASQKPHGPPARDAGLTTDGKRRLAEIRATNALVVAITNEAWGKRMTPLQRRAFAEYMRRFRLDISEVDNLGGRPYRNGFYYRRRIAEMATAGRVEWRQGEHIGDDPRLDEMEAQGDEWAKAEKRRRLEERIRLAIPTEATQVYVVRVKLRSDEKPLEGSAWIDPSRTKKGWRDNERVDVEADPIGNEHPTHTVESRAWRRVGILVAAEIPELRAEEQAMASAAVDVEFEVAEVAAEEERREASAAAPARGVPLAITEGPMEPIPVEQRERMTVGVDPYAGEPASAREAGDEPDLSHMPFPEDLGLEAKK